MLIQTGEKLTVILPHIPFRIGKPDFSSFLEGNACTQKTSSLSKEKHSSLVGEKRNESFQIRIRLHVVSFLCRSISRRHQLRWRRRRLEWLFINWGNRETNFSPTTAAGNLFKNGNLTKFVLLTYKYVVFSHWWFEWSSQFANGIRILGNGSIKNLDSWSSNILNWKLVALW